MDCHNMCTSLKVDRLCVTKEKVGCICAERLVAKEACITNLSATHLSAESETVNQLCAVNANINNLCVQNLTATNTVNCVSWRAAVTLSSNTTYNLGGDIQWNVILDDPNSNIVLSPFSYTVPVTGYYDLSFYVSSDTLMGSNVIAGVPIGLLTIKVNGNILRQFQSAYLSFSGLQNANLGSLVLLNMGDIVTMKYDVLTMDPSLGLVPYVGTVSMKGNGSFPGESGFSIHYLSSLKCTPNTGAACVTCVPVGVACDCDSMCMTPTADSCKTC